MNLRINANVVITNSEGKFLFVKLKGGPFKNSLCIPGGGINPGELSHETGKREVMEETGIEIKNQLEPFGFCELKHDKGQDHRVVLLLHGIAEGQPIETKEGIAHWLSYEEAEKDLIPFAKEAIRIWREKQSHFKLLDEETGFPSHN